MISLDQGTGNRQCLTLDFRTAHSSKSPVDSSVLSAFQPPKRTSNTQARTSLSITDAAVCKAANHPILSAASHPSRPQRYHLSIHHGDRTWAHPVAWRKAEAMALLMMARQTINSMDLGLATAAEEKAERVRHDENGKRLPKRIRRDTPRDAWALHQLIEALFPAIVRVAALAAAGGVA